MYDIILHIIRKGLEMISEGVGDSNDANPRTYNKII